MIVDEYEDDGMGWNKGSILYISFPSSTHYYEYIHGNFLFYSDICFFIMEVACVGQIEQRIFDSLHFNSTVERKGDHLDLFNRTNQICGWFKV